MRELWHGLLELVSPSACAGCGGPVPGGPEAVLCPSCDGALPRLAGDPPPTPPLDACVAAVGYHGAAEAWVHRFKYPRPGLTALDPAPLAVAALLIREAASRAPALAPQLVVPVPLHPRRLRSRGFNPASLLARRLARDLGLPWDPVALVRLRDTPSQTGLDRRARRRNLRGAFRARRPVPPRVWIVDDVVTTGSTLAEAARALKRAGAARVVGVCVAHTPR